MFLEFKAHNYFEGGKPEIWVFRKTDSKEYTKREILIETHEGTEYLFVQWKSGDYSYGGEQPFWYVFKR